MFTKASKFLIVVVFFLCISLGSALVSVKADGPGLCETNNNHWTVTYTILNSGYAEVVGCAANSHAMKINLITCADYKGRVNVVYSYYFSFPKAGISLYDFTNYMQLTSTQLGQIKGVVVYDTTTGLIEASQVSSQCTNVPPGL